MYPIALWQEDTFLAFYVAVFLAMFVTAELFRYRHQHVRKIARWGIGITVIVMFIAHLSTDIGTDRVRKHWTGRAPWGATFTENANLSQAEEYQFYWGSDRRTIPFFPKKSGRRFAVLPCVFLVAFIASQIHFRKIADQ